jgi:hypothetical protein
LLVHDLDHSKCQLGIEKDIKKRRNLFFLTKIITKFSFLIKEKKIGNKNRK